MINFQISFCFTFSCKQLRLGLLGALDATKAYFPLHTACTSVCGDPYVLLSILRTKANLRKVFPKLEDSTQVPSQADYPLDINRQTPDSDSTTALHLACKISTSELNLVHILLKANADVNIQDANQDTPLDIALASNNRSLIALLLIQPELQKSPKLENVSGHFYLSQLALSTPPERLCLIAEHIDLLDLSQNQLASLPASYSQFVNLSVINLSNNHFRSFPMVLTSLKKLNTINLSYNVITSIPSQIEELKELRVLKLKYNNLESLPSTLGKLPLKKLILTNNPLESIPKEVVNRGTAGVLSYLTQLEDSVACWKRIKLLVLGEEATGKTRSSHTNFI